MSCSLHLDGKLLLKPPKQREGNIVPLVSSLQRSIVKYQWPNLTVRNQLLKNLPDYIDRRKRLWSDHGQCKTLTALSALPTRLGCLLSCASHEVLAPHLVWTHSATRSILLRDDDQISSARRHIPPEAYPAGSKIWEPFNPVNSTHIKMV